MSQLLEHPTTSYVYYIHLMIKNLIHTGASGRTRRLTMLTTPVDDQVIVYSIIVASSFIVHRTSSFLDLYFHVRCYFRK